MTQFPLAIKLAVFITLLSILFACRGQMTQAMHTEDERAIRAADAAGLKAAQAKDVNGATANYADDAVWLPPNSSIANGKEAIRAGWSKLLGIPGLSIDWNITKFEISREGDFAYTLYAYKMTVSGANGKPVMDRGKDMAVWKKQPDGHWKIVADTFNSDLPTVANTH